MSLRRITAAQAMSTLGEFSAVIDARSESEFAEDRLPGAVNWPTLLDAERHRVGLLYAQSPFQARKEGAVLAARNIAMHLERHGAELPRQWRPLVYCWRGGQRSGALATVLDAVGWQVNVVEGGYREFRRHVLAALETAGAGLQFVVLCGPTGSGKSRLLQALQQAGEQVLDLEALACHRGSVLGALPDQPQPAQKGFDTLLWQALSRLDSGRRVFVESESRTVGRLRLPQALWQRMRESACVRVDTALPLRVALLIEDYGHLVNDPELLCERLHGLRQLRGAATVARWQALARGADMQTLVQELLLQHYDPLYERSMQSHYPQLAGAPVCTLGDLSPAGLLQAAREAVLAQHPG